MRRLGKVGSLQLPKTELPKPDSCIFRPSSSRAAWVTPLTQGTSSAADERGVELYYDLAITPAVRLNVSYKHVWNPLIAKVTENQNNASVFLARLKVAF